MKVETDNIACIEAGLIGQAVIVVITRTVCGYTCCSTDYMYADSEPTSICSFSLMLHSALRSNRYKFNSLSKFDLANVNNMAFYISGPKLLFETTEISTRPNSTQQESNYIYLYRIKVLVAKCRKPYYLHSLSQIYLSKHVYYLRIKIGSQVKHPVIEFDILTILL
jgi:hypothetical protein